MGMAGMLEKYLAKAKAVGGKLAHGEEIAGPAGAFKRSGYVEYPGGKPIMRPRFDGPEMSGGLADTKVGGMLAKYLEHAKGIASEYPRATAAAGGAGAANLLRDLLADGNDEEPDGDEDDRHKMRR